MPLQNPKGKFEQLITDGFCLAENVLDPDMLSRLQQTTNQLHYAAYQIDTIVIRHRCYQPSWSRSS